MHTHRVIFYKHVTVINPTDVNSDGSDTDPMCVYVRARALSSDDHYTL